MRVLVIERDIRHPGSTIRHPQRLDPVLSGIPSQSTVYPALKVNTSNSTDGIVIQYFKDVKRKFLRDEDMAKVKCVFCCVDLKSYFKSRYMNAYINMSCNFYFFIIIIFFGMIREASINRLLLVLNGFVLMVEWILKI